MKEKFSKEEIEEMLANSTETIIEDDNTVTDEFGNVHNIDIVINEAEKEVKKRYPKINFRWSEFEIKRAKKITQKLGLPYQTYLKSLLKQGMDNDEKRLEQM